MTRLVLGTALTAAALGVTALVIPMGVANAVTVNQQSSFGTIAKGSTICVGNLAPTTTEGVQIFGFTNGSTNLTWQVYTVSSQNAPTLVFQSTGLSVSQTIPPVGGNLLYQACVVKTASAAQDYNISLNSQPVG
jgi:hypothetical protein